MTASASVDQVRQRPTSGYLAVAGVIYVVAWVIALVVLPSGPALDASNHELALHYDDNAGAAMTQSLLAHGVAAVALVVVAWGVAGWAHLVAPQPARILRISGVVAGALSLVQMTGGLLAATAGLDDPGRAGDMFALVARADGVKMVALAVMASAGLVLARRGVLPRWHGWVALFLAIWLVPSALGYLLMHDTLALSAAPALILLLVWVCSAGIIAGRR